ncbi:MAG: PepSY domain-containing protein [Alishewanella aestuarii]
MKFYITLFLLGLLSLSCYGQTEPRKEQNRQTELRKEQFRQTELRKEQNRQAAQPASREVSKEQATRLAQQRYPGRVLKVQADNRHYRVRVMQADGRVVNVLVDGQNGRVQREE